MKPVTMRLLGLAALVVVSVAGAGCNLQWSPYAAKVGSKVITPAQLDQALHDASTDKGFRCLLERSSTAGYRLEGSGSATYDSSFSAFVLTNLIDSKVAHSIVVAHRLSEPSSARLLASAQVNDAFSSQLTRSQCGAASPSVLLGLGKALAGSFVQLQLDEDAIAARAAHVTLDAAGLSSYEAAHRALTEERCLSGIFVKTKAEADHVDALLRQGASFLSMADKYSPSSSSTGGVLGCYTSTQLAQISAVIEVATAGSSVGTIIPPLAYQGVYMVARVTSRPFEPAVAVLDQIFSTYASAFSSAIAGRVRQVGVEVNPEYGKWTARPAKRGAAAAGFGGRVQPPAGPPARFVLNESVVKGPLQRAG
ncbi:MAG: peptidylprolyl isomerase [Acidimicrobiales bacterium]